MLAVAGRDAALGHSGAALLVAEADLAGRLPDAADLPALARRVFAGATAETEPPGEPFAALLATDAHYPPVPTEEDDVAAIPYTSGTTIMPPEYTTAHLDSVGLVVACGEVRVVDDAGRPVPPGVAGEIWIRGPMVVKGYWQDEAATEREITDGFWHSGDIGDLDERGFLRVFDRKKDMVNRGGYKVFTAEVESVLCGHPEVVEAAVVGVPCPVLGERVHAFVVTRGPVAADALRVWCGTHLSDYKVPETWDIQQEPLPRNANGKLLKRVLK
ncbi:MAG: AMP-binding protein, partial [Rhodocyclaceae bacterium]|nr:AMP-binding protein [Rhodocyclaceae bacterium]